MSIEIPPIHLTTLDIGEEDTRSELAKLVEPVEAPPVSQALFDHKPLYVLDDIGQVELVDHMGGDLSVVNAARVSFAKRKEEMDEGDEKLIGFLMRNRHGTPFEHNGFTYRVKCPLFVAREWQRHRIGSFNERSGRYTTFDAEFYVPAREHIRSQVGKPGAYTFEPLDEGTSNRVIRNIESHSDYSFDMYEFLIDLGVAKEQARLVLPVNLYTEFYWSVNARSLINFLSLRTHETAMFEIRSFAAAVEHHFASKMPITHRYWDENGRGSV